jgi:hypothetical protein
MNRQEAVANITWLYATYVSRYAGNLRDAVDLFEVYIEQGGWSVQDAYDQVTGAVLHDAAFYDEAFPGHMPVIGEAFDDNAIPHHLVLDYFYPSAGPEDRNALLAQLESGAVSNRDFVHAWPFVAREEARPGVVQVLQAVMDKTSSVPALPHVDLEMSGLPDADLNFLISLYMASFGRAPEHAGLLWWAGETRHLREAGSSDSEVMREIAMRMYDGGVAHGEAGTGMVDAEYVDHAYLNVLGRQAEAAGRAFWVDQLEQGLARGEFVAAFLAATRNEDREYLDARIQVGRHVAQEHVSGPDMPAFDLGLVLEGVGNVVQAYAAIRGILDRYGEGASGALDPAQASSAVDPARVGAAGPGQDIRPAPEHDAGPDDAVVIVGLAEDCEYGMGWA